MKRLKFKKEKCIGCQLCAQVCSAMKEGEYIPSKARIAIETCYEDGNLKYMDHFCIPVSYTHLRNFFLQQF